MDLAVEAFLPQVGVQASLLFLQKKTDEEVLQAELRQESYTVFMAIAEKLGHDRRGKAIYLRDEDGAELKEQFNFAYAKARQAFNQHFTRRINGPANLPNTAEQALQQLNNMVHPDFVIANKHKHYWKIEHRIFDYQGPYRKAHQQY